MKIQVPMFSNAALFPSHLLLAARIKKCMTNRDLSRLNFQTREFHSQKQKEELLSIYLYDNYTKRRLLEFTIKKGFKKGSPSLIKENVVRLHKLQRLIFAKAHN